MMFPRFKSRLSTFAGDTDTHGVKFIASSDGSMFRKVVWSVALLGSFIFLSYFFYIRLEDFLRYETSTKVEYSSNKREIKLPTIAICVAYEYGMVVASRLTASDIINADKREAGSLLLDRQKITEMVNGKSYLTQEARDTFAEIVRNESAINDPKVKQLWIDDEDHRIVARLLSTITGKWDVLLKTLATHNLSIAVQDKNDYRVSEVYKRAGYRSSEILSPVQCRNGTSLKDDFFPCPESWRPYPGQPNCFLHNFDFGYHVELIKFMMKNHFVKSRSIGGISKWLVRINPGEESLVGFDVTDSSAATITVQEVIRLRRLGAPYTDCGDSSFLQTPVENRYSRTRCIFECRHHCFDEYMKVKSGCRWFGRQLAEISHGSLRVCSDEEKAFMSKAETDHVRLQCYEACINSSYSHLKGCPEVSCSEDQYDVSPDVEYVHRGAGKLTITFDPQVKMTTYHDVPLLSMESLLAELGGTMGLFVGISLLSIMHALEFVLVEIFVGLFKPCRGRNHVRPVSSVEDIKNERNSRTEASLETTIDGKELAATEQQQKLKQQLQQMFDFRRLEELGLLKEIYKNSLESS